MSFVKFYAKNTSYKHKMEEEYKKRMNQWESIKLRMGGAV